MHAARKSNHFRGKHSVPIAVLRRHQAVGGKQKRSRQSVKFFLLVLPCGAVVALQMLIFFKLRIRMRGQHFAMGINVDAFSFRLLQKHFQVLQIVPGHHNKRTFFHA